MCAVDREYLKAVQPFSFPPFEISIQCIAAVLLGTWGVVALQANFTPIRTTTHLAKQTVDAPQRARLHPLQHATDRPN